MDDQILSVNYLAEPGPHNTDLTLATALTRAMELGLGHVVVATDSGKTARKTLEVFGEDFDIVAVTNSRKLRLPLSGLHDYTERFREFRESLRAKGIKAIPVGMSDEGMEELRGAGVKVSRIDWGEFNAFVKRDINAIDCIGTAVRVALVCAVWGYVNGDVPPATDVISLAGTGFGGGGADVAIVVRTAEEWKDFRVLETLIRPRVSPPSKLNR
mgnify:CR=1 FL=1